MPTPLENARWGFESNCFVCELRNDAGLRIPFEHDEADGVVRASFTLDDRFSGAPSYVHGGVVLAVLDEAMAWATIALGETFAFTSETTTRFLHPVRVGRHYVVEARLEGADAELHADAEQLVTTASVLDAKGRPCAEARASFVPLGPAQALDALGTEATGDDARYVKGTGSSER
ncbi:hypothetical protein BH18ACT1_BH18ACT1_16330 [soil metagenome]|nr:PaaI family thioesterase [Acidimicrobiia bacterium]